MGGPSIEHCTRRVEYRVSHRAAETRRTEVRRTRHSTPVNAGLPIRSIWLSVDSKPTQTPLQGPSEIA